MNLGRHLAGREEVERDRPQHLTGSSKDTSKMFNKVAHPDPRRIKQTSSEPGENKNRNRVLMKQLDIAVPGALEKASRPAAARHLCLTEG